MTTTPQAWPDWYDGRHINEVLFCQQFLDKHPMKCVRGRLFTVDGLIEDEGQIGNLILEEISGVLTANLSKTVANLLASIKLQAYSPPLPIETDRIHVANGTYFMDGSFTADKSYCNNRLTVIYNPDAPTPKKWLHFLSELLQPEDIPTLQEFLGYCLLPTTKGQKMLMLIGKGGEGKSRIGLVMRSLLGDSMNTTSIQKVESNRFSRADLENKLLMVDDDMDMSALPKTNYIKSIVTSECKMDMERKGVQSYQSQLYVRFLCFGNGALTALHDKSDGFFRRQIVLTTKDRPAGRADDPFLVDKLLREKEGIFLWCLEGLRRLIGNNYQFSISGKARENMETVKRSSNNVIEFLQSEGYIRFRADSEAKGSRRLRGRRAARRLDAQGRLLQDRQGRRRGEEGAPPARRHHRRSRARHQQRARRGHQQQDQGGGEDGLRLPQHRQPRGPAHAQVRRLPAPAPGSPGEGEEEGREGSEERCCLG